MIEETIRLAPLLPLPVLWVMAAAAVMFLALPLWQRSRGVIWRVLFMAGVLLMLANPVVIETTGNPLPDQAVIIIDRSASQDIGNRRAQTDAALETVRSNLEDDASLVLKEVEIGKEPGARGTQLMGALETAISAIPREQFAGAIVITDGIIHDTAASAALATLPAPVHALITGDPELRDRRLIVERAPEFALVDRPFDIVVRTEDSDRGSVARRAELTVRVDGNEVFRREVRVDMPWPVTIHPKNRGTMLVEIETAPLSGEASLRNNTKVLSINAVRDRLRVLLISGEPHPGERVWRSTLKSDPAVDLIHFTILKLPTSQDPTPVNELALIPFPTGELFETQLERFDLVIFDRYTLRGVLQMQYLDNLARYVRGGGAILVSTGPEFNAPFSLSRTPLARVLPASPVGEMIEQGFTPKLTARGRRHPVTSKLSGSGDSNEDGDEDSERYNWGRWFRMVSARADGGDTLMSGPSNLPLLILARNGDGRVAQLMSDQIWMWARGIEGGGPHAELLRRTVHWLMKEPDLEEEALVAEAIDGQLVIERRSLFDDGGRVEVTAPDGTVTEVDLVPRDDGRNMATVPLNGPGLYRINDGSRGILAGAGELNPAEFADLKPTQAHLQPIADASGGSVRTLIDGMPRVRSVPEAADKWGRNWIGLARRDARQTLDVTEAALVPGWLAVLILLAIAVMAWWREAR